MSDDTTDTSSRPTRQLLPPNVQDELRRKEWDEAYKVYQSLGQNFKCLEKYLQHNGGVHFHGICTHFLPACASPQGNLSSLIDLLPGKEHKKVLKALPKTSDAMCVHAPFSDPTWGGGVTAKPTLLVGLGEPLGNLARNGGLGVLKKRPVQNVPGKRRQCPL